MSGIPKSSAAFAGFTEPPYWSRVAAAVASSKRSLSHPRICACTACAWSGDAVTPVPIAHTGS